MCQGIQELPVAQIKWEKCLNITSIEFHLSKGLAQAPGHLILEVSLAEDKYHYISLKIKQALPETGNLAEQLVYSFSRSDSANNNSQANQELLAKLLPIWQAWSNQKYLQAAKTIEVLLADKVVYPLEKLAENDLSNANWLKLKQELLAVSTERVMTLVEELNRKEEFVKMASQKLAIASRQLAQVISEDLIDARINNWDQQLTDAFNLEPVEEIYLTAENPNQLTLALYLAARNIKGVDNNIYQLPAMRLYLKLTIEAGKLVASGKTNREISCWKIGLDQGVLHPHVNSITDNYACLGNSHEPVIKALANNDLFSLIQILVNWSGNVAPDATHQDRLYAWCEKQDPSAKIGVVHSVKHQPVEHENQPLAQ